VSRTAKSLSGEFVGEAKVSSIGVIDTQAVGDLLLAPASVEPFLDLLSKLRLISTSRCLGHGRRLNIR